ncbi:MAG: hypothetical protein ACTS6A_02970 [Candidatus Hodgkinia cicadicola]
MELNCGIEEQLPFGLMIGATAEAPPLMKAVATRWRGHLRWLTLRANEVDLNKFRIRPK